MPIGTSSGKRFETPFDAAVEHIEGFSDWLKGAPQRPPTNEEGKPSIEDRRGWPKNYEGNLPPSWEEPVQDVTKPEEKAPIGPQSMTDESPDEIKAGQQYAMDWENDPRNPNRKGVRTLEIDPMKRVAPTGAAYGGPAEVKPFIGKPTEVGNLPKAVVSASRKLDHLGFDSPGQAVKALREDIAAGKDVRKLWDIRPADEIHLKTIEGFVKKYPAPESTRLSVEDLRKALGYSSTPYEKAVLNQKRKQLGIPNLRVVNPEE